MKAVFDPLAGHLTMKAKVTLLQAGEVYEEFEVAVTRLDIDRDLDSLGPQIVKIEGRMIEPVKTVKTEGQEYRDWFQSLLDS